MKLYIPTCSLNFNNIFSTESISPKGFYQKRRYGNKRFYPVRPNNRENEIVLYSKYPIFETEQADMENYPIVIEIETDDYKEGMFKAAADKDAVFIYACNCTVYLNPFHSIVYFRSYAEMQSTFSKAEQSLENKFHKLYRNNCIVKTIEKKSSRYGNLFSSLGNNDADYFEWDESYSKVDMPLPPIDSACDAVIDKIKGFMYCYLIGANQGTSPDIARLKAIARRLKNILTAIANSPDKKPSDSQVDSISGLLAEFKKVYNGINPDFAYNLDKINATLSQNPLNLESGACKTLLQYYRVYEILLSKLQLRPIYDAKDIWNCLDNPSQDSVMIVLDKMNYAIRKLEQNLSSSKTKQYISELVGVSQTNGISIIPRFK